jgi:hypothetical protein
VTDGKKMEGYCSTGQSPQWAVVPVEEEEEEVRVMRITKFQTQHAEKHHLKHLN